jgi:hypothetical protein
MATLSEVAQYDHRTILVAILLKIERGEALPQITHETSKGHKVTRYRLTVDELNEAAGRGFCRDLGYEQIMVSVAPPQAM